MTINLYPPFSTLRSTYFLPSCTSCNICQVAFIHLFPTFSAKKINLFDKGVSPVANNLSIVAQPKGLASHQSQKHRHSLQEIGTHQPLHRSRDYRHTIVTIAVLVPVVPSAENTDDGLSSCTNQPGRSPLLGKFPIAHLGTKILYCLGNSLTQVGIGLSKGRQAIGKAQHVSGN